MNTDRRVVVLGCGRVGKAIAWDLSHRYLVTVADTDPGACKQAGQARVEVVNEDATDRARLAALIADADLVINALPGRIGFAVLANVIHCGKNIIDISFFPEDPFPLDGPARSKGIAAVIDCGVAPGLSNMILGRHYREMQVADFVCYVGGLPKVRTWPYQYKAPFSPADVIEEYTRPARLVENGRIVVKPALSDIEYQEFDEVGTLEAFNTDGLRTLLKTVHIPNMREKTLRYPGHCEYIRVLRETGFFSSQPIDVNGTKIAPLDMTSRLLFPHWQLGHNEEEYTLMRIVIQGEEKSARVSYTYDLCDRTDKPGGLSSMARTTGFTCTAVADLVLQGRVTEVGVVPPELIGMDRGRFDYVLDHLGRRNIRLEMSRQTLS
ncbi:MAG: saccharopine dehydrogenase family protein [Dehalococcoidia bacterium]